jgi:hypothetical protein
MLMTALRTADAALVDDGPRLTVGGIARVAEPSVLVASKQIDDVGAAPVAPFTVVDFLLVATLILTAHG